MTTKMHIAAKKAWATRRNTIYIPATDYDNHEVLTFRAKVDDEGEITPRWNVEKIRGRKHPSHPRLRHSRSQDWRALWHSRTVHRRRRRNRQRRVLGLAARWQRLSPNFHRRNARQRQAANHGGDTRRSARAQLNAGNAGSSLTSDNPRALI